MTAFWIMLFPLLFLVVIGLVIMKFLKVLSNKIKIRWTNKHIFIVVTSYITLGLVAFLYLQFFYKADFTILSSEEIENLERVTANLQKYYEENDSSFLIEDYKKESWQFSFDGDVLPIEVKEGQSGLHSDIRIRYNDAIKQGHVVLSYYQLPVVLEGLDMADEIPPLQVYMSDQQLFIEPALEHSINYNLVNASLSILDLNREEHERTEITSSPYTNVLIIDVARSTNVKDLQGRIHIIN